MPKYKVFYYTLKLEIQLGYACTYMRRRFLGIPCTAFICALSPFWVDFF
jgi:hypothetical protein